MSTLTLRGFLRDILQQAYTISVLMKYRKAGGWAVLQSDEVWIYDTQKDDRVCPICRNYGTQRTFRGDEIPIIFPHHEYFPSSTPFLVFPRTHQPDLSKFHYAECRCILTWQSPVECIEARLHAEKLEDLEALMG